MKKTPLNSRYGRWSVISQISKVNAKGRSRSFVLCVCDCGKSKEIAKHHLVGGKSISCGCYRAENPHSVTHGESGTPLYHVWTSMKNRTTCPSATIWKYYGGRGIIMCLEWFESYECFRDWANKTGYQKGLEIDRINTNGNYEPTNCRWVTRKQNCRNTRSNRIISAFGEKKTLAEWAEDPRCSVGYDALSARINAHGWDFEKAISHKKRGA